MDAAGLDLLARRLRSRLPLVGGWLRRGALRRLVADGSPAAAAVIAEALADADDASLRDALAANPSPSWRDAVAEVWARRRDDRLAGLIRAWGHVATSGPARVFTALLLGRPEALADAGPELLPALLSAGDAARAALSGLRRPDTLDLAARLWFTGRDPRLADLLRAAGHLPQGPPEVRVPVALLLGRGDDLAADAGAVGPLLAACGDDGLADAAHAALRRLDGPAREELCRHALDGDDAATAAAVAAGCRPADPARRAAFLFATGQFDAFDALDFDRRLLRAAFDAGPEALRRRLAAAARAGGRAELVEVLVGGRDPRRLARLGDAEWRALLDLSADRSDWPGVWALARVAPPRRALPLLRRLADSGWAPANDADFAALTGLARVCPSEPFGPFGYERGTPHGPDGRPARALDFSPDGRLLTGAGGAGFVRVWDTAAGRERHAFPMPHQPADGVVFSADGRWLAAGGAEQAIRLWPLDGGRERVLYGCTGRVTALAWSPDGRTLVSLTDEFAQTWDLTEGDPEGKPRELSGGHRCLAIAPDGVVLATGSRDGSVWLSWHLPHGELTDRLEGHTSAVVEVAFSADGALLASADRRGEVRLWKVRGLREVARFAAHHVPLASPGFTADPLARTSSGRRAVVRVGRLADGRTVLARRRGRLVRLWSADDGKAVKTLRGHTGSVCCLAGGAGLLASADRTGAARLWGVPSEAASIADRPAERLRLSDWDRVRALLAAAPADAGLRFLDAVLRRRFRSEVHVEEGPGPAGAHDIIIEG
jgi:WD40 repeat protein